MIWRAPWLKSRASLALLGLCDTFSLVACYNVVYAIRLGELAGINNALIITTGIWVSASYLAGRYSPTDKKAGTRNAVAIVQLVVICFLIVAVFIGHSWLFGVVDANTRLRGFLLPVVVCTAILSYIVQLFANRKSPAFWVFLCSVAERDIISREIDWKSTRDDPSPTIYNSDSALDEIEGWALRESGLRLAIGESIIKDEASWERLLALKERGVRVGSVIDWCEHSLQRIPPELMSTEWLVNAEGFSLRPGGKTWRLKRLGDVAGSLILIALLWPVFLACCLAVRIEDGGPVLYSQIRTGLYGRSFRIYKIRSMKRDAEKEGLRWATKNDARITKVGFWIRKFRIDELPQLINVINGDLSLIGPRPERPEIEESLVKVLPHYRVRHWIRPGLSGWAQVCCEYGSSIKDSREKLSYDLFYLRNANILLDLLIAAKTVKMVCMGKGAKPKQ